MGLKVEQLPSLTAQLVITTGVTAFHSHHPGLRRTFSSYSIRANIFLHRTESGDESTD